MCCGFCSLSLFLCPTSETDSSTIVDTPPLLLVWFPVISSHDLGAQMKPFLGCTACCHSAHLVAGCSELMMMCTRCCCRVAVSLVVWTVRLVMLLPAVITGLLWVLSYACVSCVCCLCVHVFSSCEMCSQAGLSGLCRLNSKTIVG